MTATAWTHDWPNVFGGACFCTGACQATGVCPNATQRWTIRTSIPTEDEQDAADIRKTRDDYERDGLEGVLHFGWECPRCRAIHAPDVAQCLCPPPTVTTTR